MGNVDILLLEDDAEYAAVVAAQFASVPDGFGVQLHHVTNVDASLVTCREHDVKVAIIDLSLGGGKAGTDAISAILSFDKKIIFIIHSISPPESIADWSVRLGMPYTSQFFLQKTGAYDDAAKLYDLALKALRSYVPHLAPPLVSVGDVVRAVSRFVERRPSFRPSGVVSNIHHSQDVMNAAAQWAADRLARTGFDAMRVAVLMTGSFARLEASAASDADYFVVFDDSTMSPGRLEEIMRLAYAIFMDVAGWFQRNGIPVHDADAAGKRPDQITWHATTLPTWFPLTSILKAPLGRSTQLELTKQWFLLESQPIFNAPLAERIRGAILEGFGVSQQRSVRDAIVRSSLPESLQMLGDEFDYGYRQWKRDSLRTVKHYFMRLINLFSLRLWLLRCFLDPDVFEAPPERLFRELSPLPVARLIEFSEFLRRVPVAEQKTKQCIGNLDAIINAYGEAAHAFGSDELRAPDPGATSLSLVNDLEDAAKACGERMAKVRTVLLESSYLASHSELFARKLV